MEAWRSFEGGREHARVLGPGFHGLAMPSGAAALVVAAPLRPGGEAAASPLPPPLLGAALDAARLAPPSGGAAAVGAVAGAVIKRRRGRSKEESHSHGEERRKRRRRSRGGGEDSSRQPILNSEANPEFQAFLDYAEARAAEFARIGRGGTREQAIRGGEANVSGGALRHQADGRLLPRWRGSGSGAGGSGRLTRQ